MFSWVLARLFSPPSPPTFAVLLQTHFATQTVSPSQISCRIYSKTHADYTHTHTHQQAGNRIQTHTNLHRFWKHFLPRPANSSCGCAPEKEAPLVEPSLSDLAPGCHSRRVWTDGNGTSSIVSPIFVHPNLFRSFEQKQVEATIYIYM